LSGTQSNTLHLYRYRFRWYGNGKTALTRKNVFLYYIQRVVCWSKGIILCLSLGNTERTSCLRGLCDGFTLRQ
jgi:hypothetical protein